ncbi:hypothetical protein RM190_07590 [Paracoccus sp. CPCC 101403]|uniref:Uncharacterized protein n=2 Tax=Paracoccus broussonetiae TaxID=3075834 RepID=A0ABU3ED35_9RHOB|nr:hypothetical protein [Paracoccus sp. CPCC 101403]MDT1061717.1 hypothetical protein [Paracoccus sp. CPCC 101403]
MIRFRLAAVGRAVTPLQRYATIALSAHQSVQGPVLRRYHDGRVMIDTGSGPVTGRPLGAGQVNAPVWSPLFAGMI